EVNEADLAAHLDRYYTAQTHTGRALSYQPGQFTRLPNRYYRFQQGGIEFFALDSNTFNKPPPLPETEAGRALRQTLREKRRQLVQDKQARLDQLAVATVDLSESTDEMEDDYAKIEQIDEQLRDIDMQLSAHREDITVDLEQMDWLRQSLLRSWQNDAVRGRVLFFHHPPYVTEATKWSQGQTLAVRQNLQNVLDTVQQTLGDRTAGRSLVDLVICGHAHCFEHIETFDTGHADSHTHWLVCGGSGFSLRRQRPEGSELVDNVDGQPQTVAKSHCFIGRSGHGSEKRRPYSALRVDVTAGSVPEFKVTPLVAERKKKRWKTYAADTLLLKTSSEARL
ncbi:MAG: metallophosphoesterase, partial [Leptolyngbya sp. SIO4C1]|nr:metallophosphoesterase [Leptolyngbya sp. SIO4C1]